MNKKKIMYFATGSVIASLYVVLTFISSMFGLSSGAIQIRLSEALYIFALYTPAAIPGMFVGCLLANLFTGCVILDVIFGSIATLIGAAGVFVFRKNKIKALFVPVVSNAIIIPFILKYAYFLSDSVWFLVMTVGLGEIISIVLIGLFFDKILNNHITKLFKY